MTLLRLSNHEIVHHCLFWYGGTTMNIFELYEVLSFDVYGTLIDFEQGILDALKTVLKTHQIHLSDEQILELYGEIEARIQEEKFSKYKDVLRKVVGEFGERFYFTPSSTELNCLVHSLGTWMPFPEIVESLTTLKKKYQLAIFSNIDDDLFSLSAQYFDVDFDWVITSEQAKHYKPSLESFKFAIKKIGVSPDKILHISCSMYHDIIPARALGLSTVWVNGRSYMAGFGSTPPVSGSPDFEVPDLKTLVSIMGLHVIEESI
jgi:2-haloacid dehalogenase